MKYSIVAIVLVILVLLSTKLKSLFYKTKDATLVKEDQTLKSQQTKQEAEIIELKKPVEVKPLTVTEVEDFWNKKK